MVFDHLLHLKAPETEFWERITAQLQSQFDQHQNKWFFIKLSKCENRTVEIAWIKEFDDGNEFGHFMWDTEYRRAAIMIKFEGDKYEILCFGFFNSGHTKIWRDQVKFYPDESREDIEQSKMTSGRLLHLAFGDLQNELNAAKRKKAV